MINKVIYRSGTFIIPEEITFQRLFSKGFGTKIEKNIFSLLSYEAAYLLDKRKILICDSKNNEMTFNQVIKKANIDLNSYFVFKDLTSKGYQLKSGLKYGVTFRGYDKKSKASHSEYLIEVYTDKSKVSLKDLSGKSRVAHSTRKNFILALIDEEKSITYFDYNWKRIN